MKAIIKSTWGGLIFDQDVNAQSSILRPLCFHPVPHVLLFWTTFSSLMGLVQSKHISPYITLVKTLHFPTYIDIMSPTCYLLLVLYFTNVSAKGRFKAQPQGCSLLATESVTAQLEPTGEPLIIKVDLNVLGVRDVPDRGGSYGVDVE